MDSTPQRRLRDGIELKLCKIRPAPGYLALALVLCVSSSAFAQDQTDPLLRESRVIVDEFAQELQAALQAAMTEGGPAAAIDVCRTEAIEIASELSRRHGARVSRTSLKTRNPVNLPEPWQASVLREFENGPERDDASAAPAEYFSGTAGEPARYMRAIRAGSLCLVCHGTSIPENVTELLDREYPFDSARGYAAGDLRGAFSVVWPVSSAAAPAHERLP